jgi:Peptidase family M48
MYPKQGAPMEPVANLPIEPLPYHVQIVGHLQSHEPELWAWFAGDRVRQQENEAIRLDLLKTAYRIERDVNPSLYAAADGVMTALGQVVPVTFYQAQNAVGLNASLPYMPGEAHIVLVGPMLTVLNEVELRGVLGHELAHFVLLDCWRDYLIASQLLSAITHDVAAHPSHLATSRLFRLYTEVYCDRGSYRATGNLGATIGALVKTGTGIADISPESYLRQTEEIFQKGHPQSEGVTHPETFIRCKALQLWVERPESAGVAIKSVIEGPPSLEELDLLGQQEVSDLTRRLIGTFLRPTWLHTDSVLAHARLFFEDFQPSTTATRIEAAEFAGVSDKLRDYYCYVLLDFAAADRDLEEAPLAAALLLSDELGFGERFRQLASKELNLRKKQMQTLESDAARIVAEANEEEA